MKKKTYITPETVFFKLSTKTPLLGISQGGNPNSGQGDDGGGAKVTGFIFDEVDDGCSNSLWADDEEEDDDF